jgi:Fe-S oxidoreductase
MTKLVFAPGCALVLYKPVLAGRVHAMLNSSFGEMEEFSVCCHHDPQFGIPTRIINICPGCDKRFGHDYKDTSTVSLWELLAESTSFPFPDYHGMQMSILDACPTRENTKVHDAIRILVAKMNIRLVEPERTRTGSTCCGDSFYGELPTVRIKELMRKRASEMPVDDVVVYCVSCIKSLFIGGKRPHYLVDLLFSEETIPGTLEPDEWHQELRAYIDIH